MKSTSPQSRREFRCQKCQALLGVYETDSISIRRIDLQVAVEGKVSMTCYRCGNLNVTVHPKPSTPQSETQATAL